MRFQLWRPVGKRTPKNTCGIVKQMGYITAEPETEADLHTEIDDWSLVPFRTTASVPIVPGDILISTKVKRRFRVMSVGLNLQLPLDNTQYAWKVETRTLQQYERFAKHRDYQQCSRKKRTP